MAVDPGTKRMGLALSDDLQMLARPLEVWACQSKKADVRRVVDLVREHEVQEVVIGVPYPLEGAETASTERARAFYRAVKGALGASVRVTERDEALTSWVAEGLLAARGRASSSSEVDAMAAAVLLQEVLDERT